MIPKILHFIWVGNKSKIPQYANYSIDRFKQLNPDFKVDFQIIEQNDIIQKIKNKDSVMIDIIKKTLKSSIDKYNNLLDQLNNDQTFYHWDLFTNIYCWLSNFIRFNTLYREGGIYCDLDCYAIKKFDDNLLNKQSFAMKNGYGNASDCFFIGCEPNQLFIKNRILLENPLSIYEKRIDYKNLNNIVNKFKTCNLVYDDIKQYCNNNDSYVCHMYIGDKYN